MSDRMNEAISNREAAASQEIFGKYEDPNEANWFPLHPSQLQDVHPIKPELLVEIDDTGERPGCGDS